MDVSTGPGIRAALFVDAGDGVPGLTDADIFEVVAIDRIEEVMGRSIRLRDI